MSNFDKPTYIVHNLGAMIGPAVIERSKETKVAPEIIAPTFLGVLTAAAQDLVNVKPPGCDSTSVGSYFMLSAPSGSGKDFGGTPIIDVAREFQAEQEEIATEIRADHRAELKEWTAEMRILEDKLFACVRARDNGDDAGDQIDSLKSRISILDARKPLMPKIPEILLDNVTARSIEHALTTGWGSLLLYSQEASGQFLGSFGRQYHLLNTGWGGKLMVVTRVTTGRQSIHDPRFSMVAGIQPKLMQRYWQQSGEEASASGFFPRVLYTDATKLSGLLPDPALEAPAGSVDALRKRGLELFREGVERRRQGKSREDIVFGSEAADVFKDFREWCKKQATGWSPYKDAPAHAARASEVAARLAAAMHKVEGHEGPLDGHAYFRWAQLTSFHINQFLTLVNSTSLITQTEQDSWAVMWAIEGVKVKGAQVLGRSAIRSLCEQDLSQARVDRAIRYLVDRGQVQLDLSSTSLRIDLRWWRWTNPPSLGLQVQS